MLYSPLHGGKSTTRDYQWAAFCKAKYLGTSTIYVGTACKLGTKLYLII